MKLEDFFRTAQTRIAIIGTNPLSPLLENGGQMFYDLLSLNEDLTVKIIVESDDENFGQALLYSAGAKARRMNFKELLIHRNRVVGSGENDGLISDVLRLAEGQILDSIKGRISISQGHLRLPVNILLSDDDLWFCVSGLNGTGLASYSKVDPGSRVYTELIDLVDLYTNPNRGGNFLSKLGDDLIQMYDRQGFSRGTYPRSCFYTTEFERHSVWGFVFNRKGEIVLHQRSKLTKDGRELWDKSIGGHVELGESSTFMTAQRELVEEMFLPEAEYSKYMRADLGDILNFGEWNPQRRPERALRLEMANIGKSDWVMFRPNDIDGKPMTIVRISERRLHDSEGQVSLKKTIFRSDVYFFVAPPGYLDERDQVQTLLSLAEKAGAAMAHKLVTVDGLSAWIEELEEKGQAKETLTDDLLYVGVEHHDLLSEFSSFVRYLND